jgi:AcrR family transcriptional regulator
MPDSKISPASPAPAAENPAQKQERALLTRRELVRAARAIFARDGFEHARIADIAAAAGKTRGAFYANFKDKEDVFFALFEEDLQHYEEQMRPLLRTLNTLEERLERLVAYLCDQSQDRQQVLLALEFKVYAIRHPRQRKRLADLHAAMCLRCSLPEISDAMPEIRQSHGQLQRRESLAIGAIMDGLALNHLFDPANLDEAQIRRFLMLNLVEALGLRGLVAIPGAAAPTTAIV